MSAEDKQPWRLTLYMKPPYQDMLKEMATDADRSMSYIVGKAIQHYYETGFQEARRLKP